MTENIEQIIADAIANGTPVKLRGGEKAYLKYDLRRERCVSNILGHWVCL